MVMSHAAQDCDVCVVLCSALTVYAVVNNQATPTTVLQLSLHKLQLPLHKLQLLLHALH